MSMHPARRAEVVAGLRASSPSAFDLMHRSLTCGHTAQPATRALQVSGPHLRSHCVERVALLLSYHSRRGAQSMPGYPGVDRQGTLV